VAGAELIECDAKLDPKNVSDCMKKLSEAGIAGLIQFQGTLADPAVTCTETPSGVPVLAVEFPQPPCEKTLVQADDLRAGQIAGTAVGTWVKEKWSCTYDAYVSFESTAAASKSRLRMEGYRQGFSAICPIINEQIGRAIDTEAAATTAMTGLLEALPGKSRIVSSRSTTTPPSGRRAAKTASRPADVWVSAQGAEAKVRDLIRNDPQYIGDSAYFPELYGSTIVPAILDLVAGKTVQPLLLIEPAWVDASNIDEIYPQ
jgi:ribose transport system substrate-binding protein